MNTLDYYIVDVFTTKKYGGNQLAVFIDYDNRLSDKDMLQITRELKFSEVTFIKKNFNNQKFEGDRYEKSLKGYQAAALDAQKSLALLNFGQAAVFSAGLAGIMYLTAGQIANGSATIGDMVLVNGLLFQLSVPLFFIGSVYREVRQSLIDMEAMFQLSETPPEILDSPRAIEYNPSEMGTGIAMHGVEFAYPTAANQRPILKGTTFDIEPGKTVAFVGSSGCGKSTLSNAILLLDKPTKGQIFYKGQDITNLSNKATRDLRKDIQITQHLYTSNFFFFAKAL